jgi:DNA-binding PadR family transcriptional regulator
LREKYILEKCIILKLLKEHPRITRYLLRKKLTKLQFSLYVDNFYGLVESMEKDGLVLKEVIPGKRVCGRLCYLYTITSEGIKTLLSLEFKIQIALKTSINGTKI